MSSVSARGRLRPLQRNQGRASRRRVGRWSLVTIGLLAALLVAFLLGRSAGSTNKPPVAGPAQATSPARDASVSPAARTAAGVPVGYSHDAAGAEAAAANYVVALGSANMVSSATRKPMVAALADPQVEAAMQAQLDQAYGSTLGRFGLDAEGRAPKGQTFVSRALPIGVRADAVASDTARIEVWSAGLIGLSGRGSAQPIAATWTTTTVSLRWVDGDWKWTTASQEDGPTPVQGSQPASSADAIANAANEFGGLRYASTDR
jgi:hypothetical protein